MATRTAKLRVELDGEKQYKQAISELNSGNRVLASEMKKLAAEYEGNEKSVEALTKKQDLLQRQLQQQKDKVETLREAVQRSAEAYGESDKRTQSWLIQLNNAEAEQAKLEHALENTNQQLENQGEEFQGLGDTLTSIGDKLGIKIPQQAAQALNGIKGLSVGTIAAFTAIAAGVKVAADAIKKLHEMTLAAAKDADELLTNSLTTGLSTATLQKFQYASSFVDVSVDTMTGSMKKLQLAMYNAQNGSAEAAAKFEKLGVSIVDQNGKARSAENVWMDALDALGQMGDQTERNGLANELFGKSFDELLPLIKAGSDELRKLGEEAEATGYVLNESQIKVLGELDDQVEKNRLKYEALQNQIAVQFAPASKAALEVVGKAVEMLGDALVDSKLVENFAALVENIGGVVSAGMDLFGKMPSWMNPINRLSKAFETLNGVMGITMDMLGISSKASMQGYGTVGWDVAGAEWKDDVQAWVTKGGTVITPDIIDQIDKQTGKPINTFDMGYSGSAVSYGHMSEAEIRRLMAGYNAGGIDNWRGGLTWVGEAGPELVSLPQGSRIYSNQDSRQMGGDQIININVNGIRELEEIVSWYESRRIRGRMR